MFKVAKLLGLENMDNTITIGNNFHSNKMGSKGMIKISDKFFCDEEINRIALIAPNVILNIIRDYEVVEKKTVTLPDELVGLVKCNNPKCITNNEPMPTRFDVIDKEKGTIRCHYCERDRSRNAPADFQAVPPPAGYEFRLKSVSLPCGRSHAAPDGR